VTTPDYASLAGQGFGIETFGYSAVAAFGSAGGHDMARMYDGPGNDTFHATPAAAALFGQDYRRSAADFDSVRAVGSAGGSDEAWLFDSDQADLLEAAGPRARLSGAAIDYLLDVLAFDRVTATATTGDDGKSVIAPLDFILAPEGPWRDL